MTQVLSVDEKNRVEKEVREYTKAQVKGKAQATMGDVEQPPQETKETLPIEGRTFEINREEESTNVTPKGDKKDIDKSMYATLTLHEGAEALLPERAVRPGDRWTIEGKKLLNWASRGMQGSFKLKDLTGSVECVLKEVKTVEGKRTARVEYTVNFEASGTPIQMNDQDEEPATKIKVEVSLTMKNGKGEFLFAIDDGFSLSMDLDTPMQIEMTQHIESRRSAARARSDTTSRSPSNSPSRRASTTSQSSRAGSRSLMKLPASIARPITAAKARRSETATTSGISPRAIGKEEAETGSSCMISTETARNGSGRASF
jgi:hypothetical protein